MQNKPVPVFSKQQQHHGDLSEDEDEDREWKSKPDVWSDDVRMNALFAAFRNRDLNPLHYDNKLKFWKETISAYCAEKQLLQVDLTQLEAAFTRKNIKPKCLDLVLTELAREGVLKTRAEVLKPKVSLIQTMFKMAWTPLAWSASFVIKQTPFGSMVTTSPSQPTSPFTSPTKSSAAELNSAPILSLVNVELIDAKAQELLKQLQSGVVYRNVDCVMDYERLRRISRVSESDLDLLVKYLEVNQKVMVNEGADGKKLVKFALGQYVAPFTPVELSYVGLKDAESKFEAEATKLADQVEALNVDIKAQLRLGNKAAALKLLKKRKQVEKALESKDATITNIESMLMSIQQADTNQIAYDIYSKGAEALKEANKGISVDKLDDTIADIQDIMNANSEIEEAFAKPVVPDRYQFDEQELNVELNELLASESASSKTKTGKSEDSFDLSGMLESLPDVPVTSPKRNPFATQYTLKDN